MCQMTFDDATLNGPVGNNKDIQPFFTHCKERLANFRERIEVVVMDQRELLTLWNEAQTLGMLGLKIC